MSQPVPHHLAAAPPDRTGRVLLWSGLLGFALGALFAGWQVVVETGQVIAGLVRYPVDNPFFIYHVKIWSLLNQMSGLFLRLGVSEIALSVIVSGLLGLLSFQALSLVVYVLSRDAFVAIGAAFVIFLGGATNYGVVYPIALLGTEHTYGVVGLAWVVLVPALFGAGRPRAAGFLLGLAPAVHPSLGVWLGVLLGLAGLWNRRQAWTLVRPGLGYFLAGGAFTALSLAVQFALQPPLPHVDAAESARYLDAFVGFWDGHRAPVDFARAGIVLNIGALVVSVVWLIGGGRVKARGSDPVVLLLRFIAVTAAASLALAFVSHLPPSAVPTPLLVLMPSRLLNINVMMGAALLFGLLGRRPGMWRHGAIIATTLVLLFSSRSTMWQFFEPGGSRTVAKLGLPLFVVLLVVGAAVVGLYVARRYVARTELRSAPRTARAAVIALMAAAMALSFLTAIERDRAERDRILHDRTNDRLFGFAARESGFLLTGGDLHLIQLRSRRPVLLDGGGLDALPYALEAAPAMDRILRDVYGVDLFHPPEEARGQGKVPLEANRTVWEGNSPARWQEIGRTYGVTQVMTPGDWHLELPMVVAGQGIVLYTIPR
jgi:uncharacterized protein YneF (UPF0154 family)